jgi:DNA polymerase I-like protein with 3'-5' exonuclease and polymerase domains
LNTWDDDDFCVADFETSGAKVEYALQPWRASQGLAWPTSLCWVWRDGARIQIDGNYGSRERAYPDRVLLKRFLEWAILQKRRVVGWNTAFDIMWFLAYDLEDLVMELQWLDGMLLYRHLEVEPEYNTEREKKRAFGLKPAVETFMPQHAGYADDINYHDDSPEERAKLWEYNIRDDIFTLRITRDLWRRLNPRQLSIALTEAECLPLVAQANLHGMILDTIACQELVAYLDHTADSTLTKLQWFGVTEQVVRSPIKMAALLFDQWKLEPLKYNTGKKTGKVTRSTDKEVLHELSFRDTRVADLRAYREALNNRTKFAQGPLNSVAYNEDGRVHPLARVFGTYSGRLTYASKQKIRVEKKGKLAPEDATEVEETDDTG